MLAGPCWRWETLSAFIKTLTRRAPDPIVVNAWRRAGVARLTSAVNSLKKKKLSHEGLQALYYLTNELITNSRMGWGETTIAPERAKLPSLGVPKELRDRLRQLGSR